MIARYPEKGAVDEAAERSFGPVIGLVEALRNIRGEMNIPFKVALREVQVGALAPEALATVREELSRVVRLANVAGLSVSSGPTRKVPGSAVAVGSGFEVRVPLAGAVDMAAEKARIAKELARIEGDSQRYREEAREPELRRARAQGRGGEGPRARGGAQGEAEAPRGAPRHASRSWRARP